MCVSKSGREREIEKAQICSIISAAISSLPRLIVIHDLTFSESLYVIEKYT